jgi:hypothetical protein
VELLGGGGGGYLGLKKNMGKAKTNLLSRRRVGRRTLFLFFLTGSNKSSPSNATDN